MKLQLKEWIAKITGQTEFRTLLWTNPSPTSVLTPQTISLDLSEYDAVEVHGVNYSAFQSIMPSVRIPVGSHGNLIGLAGSTGDSDGTGFLVARGIVVNTDSIAILTARGVQTNGALWYSNNANMIPIKIYGIKYVGGGTA